MFFNITFFQNIHLGILSGCQTAMNMPGLIWVQTVCKGYQRRQNLPLSVAGKDFKAYATYAVRLEV